MKSTTLIIAALASITCLSVVALQSSSTRAGSSQSIDRIIGSGEFNAVYPIIQTTQSDQKRQITDRLAKMVTLLRSRDLSDMPVELRAERERNLARLLEYRERGEFPVNYDHAGAFLPCFIDRAGAICAVGYLVEQSAGRDLAEQINSRYQYATVQQMRSPALDKWIASSGFSRAEIITIQEPAMEYYEEVTPAGDTVIATRMGKGISPARAISDTTRLQPTRPLEQQVTPARVQATPVIGQAR